MRLSNWQQRNESAWFWAAPGGIFALSAGLALWSGGWLAGAAVVAGGAALAWTPVCRAQRKRAAPSQLGVGHSDAASETTLPPLSRPLATGSAGPLTLEHLAAAVEQAGEAILITDARGIICYVNPACMRITGYSAEDLLGKTPKVFSSGKHDKEFYNEIWAVLREGGVWHGRFINRRHNGELFEEDATISPLRAASGEIVSYVAVKRDVSREVRLEQQVRQQQKLEAIGTLAGGIAHDFNNILTAMLGFAELSLQDLEETNEVEYNLNQIVKSGFRARDLVRQILTFSRHGESTKQSMHLDVIVDEAAKLLRATIPSSVTLDVRIAQGCPKAMADFTQIQQVVMNLGTNAFHAVKQTRGRIDMMLEGADLEEDDVQGLPAGHYLHLTVSDTGPGIEPTALEHIFEPFFTTRKNGEGTGLGLSTSHGIVKEHGGAITVDSTIGEGATFHVYLPEAPDNMRSAQNRRIPNGANERILLIDDERTVLQLASQILKRLNYQVDSFEDSAAALKLFKADPDAFDLIISDHSMPQLSGEKMLEQMRAIRHDLPVLMMTGKRRYEKPVRNAAGVKKKKDTQVLYKPFLREELAVAVDLTLKTKKGGAPPGDTPLPKP